VFRSRCSAHGNSVTLFAAALVACVASPISATAQELILERDVLFMSGRLPLVESSLARSLRVTATGIDSTLSLDFVPEDLVLSGGAPNFDVIDRRHVTMSQASLDPDVPEDVVVTVAGLTRAGIYEGAFEVRLMAADGRVLADKTALIRLDVRPAAEIQLVAADSAMQRVNCTWACLWAERLVHQGVTSDELTLRLQHTAPVTLDVTSLELVLFGSHSRELVSIPPQLLPDTLGAVPPKGATATYSLPRGTLAPDAYRGELLIELAGVEQPVHANFRLDVRDGPLLPMVLLASGIMLSRLLVKLGFSVPPKADGSSRTAAGPGTTEAYKAPWPTALAGFRWQHPAPDRPTATFAWLSGVPWSSEMGVTAFPRVARAVAVLVLLATAAAQGIETLYVNDPTFGDSFVLDYLKVFLWPFTADVVVRGLANIKWPGS
jgi:hypothetical protein